MHTARDAWEASWQRDFDCVWNSPRSVFRTHTLSEIFGEKWAKMMGTQKTMSGTDHNTTYLVDLQVRLAKMVVIACHVDDFEGRWMALAPKRRECIILEGIYRCMADGPAEVEEAERRFCPESSLAYLATRDGEVYLDLLKGFLPLDLVTPLKEPISIPHAAIDRLCTLTKKEKKSQGWRSATAYIRQCRIAHLTELVLQIFLAFVSFKRAAQCRDAADMARG